MNYEFSDLDSASDESLMDEAYSFPDKYIIQFILKIDLPAEVLTKIHRLLDDNPFFDEVLEANQHYLKINGIGDYQSYLTHIQDRLDKYADRTLVIDKTYVENAEFISNAIDSERIDAKKRRDSSSDMILQTKSLIKRGRLVSEGFNENSEGNLLSVVPANEERDHLVVRPNFLYEQGFNCSIVVFDPKGFIMDATAKIQKDFGRDLFLMDPFSAHIFDPRLKIKSYSINPLAFIKRDDNDKNTIWIECLKMAELLCASAKKDQPLITEARYFLCSIMIHILTDDRWSEEKTLFMLIDLFQNNFNLYDIISSMASNQNVPPIAMASIIRYREMMEKSDRTYYTIRSIIVQALGWLKKLPDKKSLMGTSLDLEHVLATKSTLYICPPPSYSGSYEPFSKLIIGLLLSQHNESHFTKNQVTYYLLNDFQTLGYFPKIVDALRFSSLYKLRIWLYIQYLSQLEQYYNNEERNEIIDSLSFLRISANDNLE